MLSFVEYLLCGRHCAEWFPQIFFINLTISQYDLFNYFPHFIDMDAEAFEMLRNFFKVTQLISDRDKIHTSLPKS